MDDNRRKKVICPVEGKDGKTHWLRLGCAFVNRDSSINLFLDGLPVNGKLQVRDWDEPSKDAGLAPPGGAASAPPRSAPRDEMPF